MSSDVTAVNKHGFGDFNDEGWICNVPSPESVSSARSDLDLKQTKYYSYNCPPARNMAHCESIISLLSNHNDNQKQYLKLQDCKYTTNKELIAHLQALLKKEAGDCKRKKSEIASISKECAKYENQIKYQIELCAKGKERFSVEVALNEELKKKKMRLETIYKLQNRSDHDFAGAVKAPKRLSDGEQYKSGRLQQKGHCIGSENVLDKNPVLGTEVNLPHFKTGNGLVQSGAPIIEEKSPKRIAVVLPDISKGKVNLKNQKNDSVRGHSRSQTIQNIVQNAASQKLILLNHQIQKKKNNVEQYHGRYEVDGF